MSLTQDQVIDYLSTLTVMDIVNLTKALEEKWGVKAAPVAVAGAAGPAAAAAPVAEAQTEFTVVLKAKGAAPINVIKVVREITGLGLKDAKDLVDGAPKEVKANVPKAEAETSPRSSRTPAPRSRSSSPTIPAGCVIAAGFARTSIAAATSTGR
jgi:large subunit ribosomal protein L7/L12